MNAGVSPRGGRARSSAICMYVSYDIDTRTPYVEGHRHGTIKVKYWTMWELAMVNHSHVRKQQCRICPVQV